MAIDSRTLSMLLASIGQPAQPDPRALAGAVGAPVPAPQARPSTLGDTMAGAPSSGLMAGPSRPRPDNLATQTSAQSPQSLIASALPMLGNKPATLGDTMGGPLNIADTISQSLAMQQPHEKRVLGMKGSTAAAILGTIGDALMAYGGMQPQFAPTMARQQEDERQMAFDREKIALELEAKRRAALDPRPEQVGNTIGIFNPSTNTYDEVYTAPQPFELYARSLGLTPGTQEYIDAIKEYRAGTYNEAGVEGRLAVQAPRLAVTTRGQDLSHGDRVRGQNLAHGDRLRGQDVSRDNNIRSTGQSNTNSVRSNETTRGSYGYTHGRRGGGGGTANGPIAVGPDGKQYTVKNGQWVPIQ